MSNVLSHKDLMRHLEKLRTQGSERTRRRRGKLAKDASIYGGLSGLPEHIVSDNAPEFSRKVLVKAPNDVEMDHTDFDFYIVDPEKRG